MTLKHSIAALFVEKDGVYFNVPGIDPWGKDRDARLYIGPNRVIAHPPCERWGRYWSGGPSANVRRKLGDDDGCFYAALKAVERNGGVIEHPEASHAWKHFGIAKPAKAGTWRKTDRGWTCCVEQGHYGHPARKATWLYCVNFKETPPRTPIVFGPAKSKRRLDHGFHSAAERRAKAHLVPKVKRLTKRECVATPVKFRDLLIKLVSE